MLEALKLVTAPSPAKARAGSGADPADSAFAGLMVQAANAPPLQAASNPEPSREGRSAIREDRGAARESRAQRQEAQDVRPAKERQDGHAEKLARVESSCESSDRAKAASTMTETDDSEAEETLATKSPSEDAPTQVADAAQVIPGTEAGVIPQAPVPQAQPEVPATAAAAIPQGATAVQATKPEPPVAKPEARAQEPTPRADAALKGLAQEIQPAGEEPGNPARPALTELLFIPKVEIQTPKLNPGSVKAHAAEAPDLAPAPQTETAGDPESGTGLTGSGTNAETAGEARAIPPEQAVFQIPPQRPTAPSAEPVAVSMAEGAKTAQTASRVETAAAVRPSPVFTQVEGSIRWILHNKAQGAELQLHPEALGRMVIQLRVEGQEVHARLWASEPTSLALLQDHKTFLESSLREQGLSLGSFDLQSGARGDGAQSAPQERPDAGFFTPPVPLEIKQEMPTGPALDATEARRIEVFA